jgi:hypothetical protein
VGGGFGVAGSGILAKVAGAESALARVRAFSFGGRVARGGRGIRTWSPLSGLAGRGDPAAPGRPCAVMPWAEIEPVPFLGRGLKLRV